MKPSFQLDIVEKGKIVEHWEATTVEKLLMVLEDTIVEDIMRGKEVRISKIKKTPIQKLTRCPQCNEVLIPALKGKTSAWCDNCCCEITVEVKDEKNKSKPNTSI